ncbi:MAG: hypothetical protein WA876_12405 [Candidatus Acidiferrales bacterium]
MKSVLRLASLFSLFLIASSAAFAQATQPVVRPVPSIGSTFGMNAPFESGVIVTGLPLSYQGQDQNEFPSLCPVTLVFCFGIRF